MRGLHDGLRSGLQDFRVFDWSTGPVTAIFLRELLVALRYRRFAILMIGIASALLLAIAFNLVRMAAGAIPPQVAVTNVVGLQVSALLLILFFVIPALGAVALSSERQQETEELLMMVLDAPGPLVVGKLLGMLFLFAAFHITLLPFSVFTYFFAGIEIFSFFQITFMLYGTALCHSILGVAFSRLARHTNTALFATYASLFLVYFLPSWLLGQWNPTVLLPGSFEAPWYVNPLALLRDLLHSLAGWRACFQFLAHQLLGVGAVIVVGWALARCARRIERRPWRRPSWLADTVPQPVAGPIPDWSNVVYFKDCHTSALARPAWSAMTFLLGVAAAALFTFWSARYTFLTVTVAHGATALLALLTPLLVLERCRTEMNPISLLMLRVTRISSRQVLLGKGLAVSRSLAPLFVGIMIGGLLPLLLGDPTSWTGGHPATPSRLLMAYQLTLLPLKLGFAIIVSFVFVRFRSPSASDMAITLVLSCLVIGGLEFLRSGLFDTADWKQLMGVHFGMLLAGQYLLGVPGMIFGCLIALTRFEMVFDEGSDVFAAGYVDRGSY